MGGKNKQADMEPVVLTASIPASMAGQRLDRVLAQLFSEYSRARLQQWIRDDCVRLDGAHPRSRDKVTGGERVEVHARLEPQGEWRAESIPLEIVFADQCLLVVNKPAGLVVHPAAGNRDGTLVNALLGAGLSQMILTIALLFWPGTARIIRAQVMSVRQRGYIGMARSFGGSPVYIFVRHVLPQIAPLIVFGLVTAAGRAVALEAGLAFLGLGDPTAKSWGLIMRYALNLPGLFLTDRWLWWLLPPGICITLLILSLTFIGMGTESHLDTRLRQR